MQLFKRYEEIIKSLKESGLLVKGVSEIVQYEVKEQKCGFLNTLSGTLGASLLRNPLTGKSVKRKNSSNIPGRGVMRAGKGTIRAGQSF